MDNSLEDDGNTAIKFFKKKERLTCSPALWERDTAFALALPLSFPALPPACVGDFRKQ